MKWNDLLSTENRGGGLFLIPSLSCACPHLLVCNVSSSLTHPYPHGGISRHPVNFHPPLRGGGTLSKSELLLEHHFHGCCDRESNPSFFMACLGAMCRPYYALAIITVVIISVASGQGLCLHIPPRNTPHRSAGHTQDMEVRLPRFSTHCNMPTKQEPAIPIYTKRLRPQCHS